MAAVVVLLLEEILHHMGCEKTVINTGINSLQVSTSAGVLPSTAVVVVVVHHPAVLFCDSLLRLVPRATTTGRAKHRRSCAKNPKNPTRGAKWLDMSPSAAGFMQLPYMWANEFLETWEGFPYKTTFFWGDLGALVATICLDMYSRFKIWEASN